MPLLFASSVYAALLAFHNAVARYAYALGREVFVPETLGRTHNTHSVAPHGLDFQPVDPGSSSSPSSSLGSAPTGTCSPG